MIKKGMSNGVVHTGPSDFKKALTSSPKSKTAWEDITPLARNEWICWITSVKKNETRKDHIKRAVINLAQGKRRPCCWAGCPHRSK